MRKPREPKQFKCERCGAVGPLYWTLTNKWVCFDCSGMPRCLDLPGNDNPTRKTEVTR